MITPDLLLAARPHDIQSLDTLLEGFEGMAPANQGFLDEWRHSLSSSGGCTGAHKVEFDGILPSQSEPHTTGFDIFNTAGSVRFWRTPFAFS